MLLFCALKVYKEENGRNTVLKEIEGQQGDKWLSMSVNLAATTRSATYVKALIEATVGGSLGDVAIDDIKITNRRCCK